jgi:hypothetical protein
LHWPEAYYLRRNDGLDLPRRARFQLDLALATRNLPLVLTAHNLHTHNRQDALFERFNTNCALHRASGIFAHGDRAKARLLEKFRLDPMRCHVIPHGDLSSALGIPLKRAEARQELELGPDKLCLMFGAIEPYKGIEEVIKFWNKQNPPATLAIIGKPISKGYAHSVVSLTRENPRILTGLSFQTPANLKCWLSATDCLIFNYQEIFTSGAACLARSFGVPLLLPERLNTVDLQEPNPRVFRFNSINSDFAERLGNALDTSSDFAAARDWRDHCAWTRIAEKTAAIYRDVIALKSAQFPNPGTRHKPLFEN